MLLAWQRSTTIRAGYARRGRIILLVAEGMPISHIADMVGINRRFIYSGPSDFSTSEWRASLTSRAVAPGDTRRRTPTPPVRYTLHAHEHCVPSRHAAC